MEPKLEWTQQEVLAQGRKIILQAGAPEPLDFGGFANLIVDAVKSWSKADQDRPWVKPFLLALKKILDDFDREVELDPMLLYKPAHAVALAFHQSEAKNRYFRTGNRCSKTQSAYAEHYFHVTGSHPWLKIHPPPASTFIVSASFFRYAPDPFESKLISGEAGNPLSPIFPEEGRWLNHYDRRKYIITLACPACAAKNRPRDCKHPKSRITLFTGEGDVMALAGGQYNLGHLDEHVEKEFFEEGTERLKTVPNSRMIITATPLEGKMAWEHQKLTSVWNLGPIKNRIPGTEKPFVSLHTIDQYSSGLMAFEEIEASKIGLDPITIGARIYGKPGAIAKHAVFDRWALSEMEDNVKPPTKIGYLRHESSDSQQELIKNLRKPEFIEHPDGMLSIWEPPEPGQRFIIGCDVAAGIVKGSYDELGLPTGGDYSAAPILRVPDFVVAGVFHGWINPNDYGTELVKLGWAFNCAWLVVERNGMGLATIDTIMKTGYPMLFREKSDLSQAEWIQDPLYGIDTNVRSKAPMVASLVQCVADRLITVHDSRIIQEMKAFGQEYLPHSGNVRLRGESGAHDDLVMGLVFATYVACTYPSVYGESRTSSGKDYSPFWKELHREIDESQKSARDQYFTH